MMGPTGPGSGGVLTKADIRRKTDVIVTLFWTRQRRFHVGCCSGAHYIMSTDCLNEFCIPTSWIHPPPSDDVTSTVNDALAAGEATNRNQTQRMVMLRLNILSMTVLRNQFGCKLNSYAGQLQLNKGTLCSVWLCQHVFTVAFKMGKINRQRGRGWL